MIQNWPKIRLYEEGYLKFNDAIVCAIIFSSENEPIAK